MKVKFVAEARIELFAIASDYERMSEGLAEAFLLEAERTITYINDYPLARADF